MDSLAPTSERVFSLQDLAVDVAEHALRYWYRADDYLSEWPASAAEDLKALEAEIKAPRRVSPFEILDWTPGGVVQTNGNTNDTLEAFKALDSFRIRRRLAVLDRREDMERRRAALFRRIAGRIRYFISSNDCTVQGIGPAGSVVEVPHAILPQLEIDLRCNVLCTVGGGIKWEAVVVVLASQQRPAGRSKRTAPPVDRLQNRRRGETLLEEIYGKGCLTNGRLDNEPAPAVQKALADRGLSLGIDGVRRLLGRKEG